MAEKALAPAISDKIFRDSTKNQMKNRGRLLFRFGNLFNFIEGPFKSNHTFWGGGLLDPSYLHIR